MAIVIRQMPLYHSPAPQAETVARRISRSWLRSVMRLLWRDRLTVASGVLLAMFAALAVLGPAITSALGLSANSVDLSQRFEPPSTVHWLGTDDFGRDQLARMLYGAQVSLFVGFLAALINLTVGLGLGMTAALYGTVVDDAI